MRYPPGLGSQRTGMKATTAERARPQGDHLRCAGCPFKQAGVVSPYGRLGASCAVIGKFPQREELKTGRPFAKWSGEVTAEAMSHAGLDFALDARLFNAVSCAPTNSPRRLLNEARKACSGQLMSDVLAGQHRV